MPDMQDKKWSNDNDALSHDYLRNLPLPIAKRMHYCSQNATSLPSQLNILAKRTQLLPINRTIDDEYLLDLESDNYVKKECPSPLIISKVIS